MTAGWKLAWITGPGITEVTEEPRAEFYRHMDAANVDLKAFSERFYHKLTGAHLQPVLDTLIWLKRESDTWFEITTLLIPGENDSDAELTAMSEWIVEHLGPDVPLRFTAFHPDYRMRELPPTPPETLRRARDIALRAGLRYVYVGNVHDAEGSSTYCPGCGALLIERDWYRLGHWGLDAHGACGNCGSPIAGVFEPRPGTWGPKRRPVRLATA